MQLELTLDNASQTPGVPAAAEIHRWAEAALAGRPEPASLGIRLVDEVEGADLNRRFRNREGPTNVLSFPYEPLPGLTDCDLLGDLVICVPLAVREAAAQGKALEAHLAHLVVHGVLHLLGYDHETPEQATEMEGLESGILSGLGFPAPYEDS